MIGEDSLLPGDVAMRAPLEFVVSVHAYSDVPLTCRVTENPPFSTLNRLNCTARELVCKAKSAVQKPYRIFSVIAGVHTKLIQDCMLMLPVRLAVALVDRPEVLLHTQRLANYLQFLINRYHAKSA